MTTPTDPPEWALCEARFLVGTDLAPKVALALDAARRRGIEEAVVAALGHLPDRRTMDPVMVGYLQGRKDAAFDIRALADKEPT